jgi:hypothetical protein
MDSDLHGSNHSRAAIRFPSFLWDNSELMLFPSSRIPHMFQPLAGSLPGYNEILYSEGEMSVCTYIDMLHDFVHINIYHLLKYLNALLLQDTEQI